MIETERKYEADAAAELPDLTGLPAVAAVSEAAEFRLEAEYFDTADLRLLRAGITLRRRRGGHDAGWHLKLPAGPDAREELTRPLGRSRTVPADLARLVRVHARGAALRPVARIDTVRRQRLLLDEAGQPLAEVVDDLVSASSMGEVTELSEWREIEVELTGGNRALLEAADARLRRAGLRRPDRTAKLERALGSQLAAALASQPAPPAAATPRSRAGEVVLAYLAGQAAALRAQDPRVRRDEPDAVHQMRVASRRLRSTLQTFQPVLPDTATERLRAELKWLGEVLGQARDGEVLTGHIGDLLAGVPADLVLGPVQATVAETLAPRRAAASRAAVRALDSPRYFALLDELDALLAAPPLTEAAAAPAAALRAPVARSYRRLRKRMARAAGQPAGPARDAALHEARKAAKRARYAGEALAPAAGRPARRFTRRMKAVQSALGDHHDTVVARAALRDLGVRAHLAGENGFTFGLLHEADAGVARASHRQARAAWHRASHRKYRRWLA
jgi:CHAD domain-containing protein